MKTSTSKKTTPIALHSDPLGLISALDAYWAKFNRLSKAKQRARLIEMGALTPEGKVPVYPMDHVPLGPRH